MQRWVVTLAAASAVAAWWGGTAVARSLAVDGSVSGTLSRGHTVTFRIDASHPDGWRALDELVVILSLRGAPLEELVYEVDSSKISAGASSGLTGTGNVITGRFLRVRMAEVQATTGGERVNLSFPALLLDDVPTGVRFEFVAEDDEGAEASVGRIAVVAEDEEAGFPWEAVAVAAAAALLAGGFVGSRFAAHRRTSGRSIYHDVARRILEERERGSTEEHGSRS